MQTNKWCSYISLHIEDRLPDIIRQRLARYEKTHEAELQTSFRPSNFLGNTTSSNAAAPIVVFDPDTRMIVKQYSSQAAAKTAALMLFEMGYACEYTLLTATNIKSRIENAEDPEKLLFGYQWLPTSKLISGDFKVKKSSEVVLRLQV